MNKRLRILLATDYSEAAQHAEDYALHLSSLLNAELILLHVYRAAFDPGLEVMELAEKAEARHSSEMKRLQEKCNALMAKRTMRINQDYKCIVRDAHNIGDQVAREAEIHHADFIIIGTHGVNGFHKLFFGSHAWDIIKKSNLPAFAIPKDARFAGINHIVFGTSYREGEIPGLTYLIDFARLFDAEITVLHITNYILSKRFEKQMFEKFRNQILETIHYPKMKIHLMVDQNISDGVKKFCETNQADLLVMTPEKPSLFGKFFITNMSMTRKTIFNTHIPVLTIPDFYVPAQFDPARLNVDPDYR